MDALALGAEEGRWRLRKASGSCQPSFDPRISELGNLSRQYLPFPPEHIGRIKGTRGSETSQYPQEEKTTVIPRVVASESGSGQTYTVLKPAGVAVWGLWGRIVGSAEPSQSKKVQCQSKALEKAIIEGDNPVDEDSEPLFRNPK